jgi:hypothetical protein
MPHPSLSARLPFPHLKAARRFGACFVVGLTLAGGSQISAGRIGGGERTVAVVNVPTDRGGECVSRQASQDEQPGNYRSCNSTGWSFFDFRLPHRIFDLG